MWQQPESFPQWSPVCVSVSEQLFQWLRAQVPLILKIFPYIHILHMYSIFKCARECSWWLMMNIFAFELVLDSHCFFWFCWRAFEYVVQTNILPKHDSGLWTSLLVATYQHCPQQSPAFSKTHMLQRCLESRNNLPTCSNSGATLWPALVFHLFGIDGRGIGISGTGCHMGHHGTERNVYIFIYVT